MIGWLVKKWNEFHAMGQIIDEAKADGVKALGEVRQAIVDGELDTHQLAAVTECLDSMSVRLEKNTDKLIPAKKEASK